MSLFRIYHFYKYTVCPGSSDPFYIVTYYIKWVTSSWTYSIFLWRYDNPSECGANSSYSSTMLACVVSYTFILYLYFWVFSSYSHFFFSFSLSFSTPYIYRSASLSITFTFSLCTFSLFFFISSSVCLSIQFQICICFIGLFSKRDWFYGRTMRV